MAKATSGWYPEIDVAHQAQTTADGYTTVQVGPIVCTHLRACTLLSSTGATLDNHSAAALAHRRPAVSAGRHSAVLAWLLYATLAGAAIVTMVDPVGNVGVADTLEARLSDTRKLHADGEYGTIPLMIVELGIRSQWATEHPSRPVSPRPVRNEEPQLEVVGLKGFADDTVPIPPVDDVELHGEFRAAHLLTFMVISRKPVEGGSGSGRSTEDVDEKRSMRDKGRGGGGRPRECWICHDPDHLSYECLDCDDSDEDDTKGGRGRPTSRRPRQDAKPRKEKQTSKKTSSTKDIDNSSGKS
ncbi:unnamed protein product [Closterium sp. NIES-53]